MANNSSANTSIKLISQPDIAQAEPVSPPWYVTLAINSGILALHQVLHNPHQAAYLRATMIQLRDAITAAYGSDE